MLGCTGLVDIAMAQENPFTSVVSSAGIEIAGTGLTIRGVRRAGRSIVHEDPIEARIVAGTWKTPVAGQVEKLAGGKESKWEAVESDKDGSFPSPRGGYLELSVHSAAEQIALLEAVGHGMLYVNGEPRVGDIYGNGIVHLPILLRKGVSELLFQSGRQGKIQVKIKPVASGVHFDTSDSTLPDLVLGEETKAWGAVLVRNDSKESQAGVSIRVAGQEPSHNSLPGATIPPLSIRKIPFRIVDPAPSVEGDQTLKLEPCREEDGKTRVLDSTSVSLRRLKPEQTRKATFQSEIDGSVQYYALVPAQKEEGTQKPGLVLTLHGAGVEALGQATCYAPKPGLHVVASTNRRPFGFDWEDWGRLDALEVLHQAQEKLQPDPKRIYLTGHSMGGHGTWSIGANYPDRFAAIGPSAGWISMASYGGAARLAHPDAVEELLQRASSVSDTLALEKNYAQLGIYVLHGDKDDNVPVREARTMKEHLSKFHHDFLYHEQPGAGHWWGNPCMDWPPMFEFFAKHRQPDPGQVLQVSFQTASPGISARCHWLKIESQIEPLRTSSADVRFDPETHSLKGSTANVSRLTFELSCFVAAPSIVIELDGDKLDGLPWPSNSGQFHLRRHNGRWHTADNISAHEERPERSGLFKDAFRHRVIFVYGTRGTPAENAWALAKVRYDTEQFWYRGNGSVDIIADSDFIPERFPDRNVVLYGNADTNTAWNSLLASSSALVSIATSPPLESFPAPVCPA
jgi:pimeloyl-ACP methyl ester carboxylesterase